jgi:molybdate transport system regulatory protein
MPEPRHPLAVRFWLEKGGRALIGRGRADILEAIERSHSIARASRSLGMSYRHVWNELKRIEESLGEPVLVSKKGGFGGGRTDLSTSGKALLREFRTLQSQIHAFLGALPVMEGASLRLSARNILSGVISEITEEAGAMKIKIEIRFPTTITAVVTKDAARDLELKKGDTVHAIFKATEVIVGK